MRRQRKRPWITVLRLSGKIRSQVPKKTRWKGKASRVVEATSPLPKDRNEGAINNGVPDKETVTSKL